MHNFSPRAAKLHINLNTFRRVAQRLLELDIQIIQTTKKKYKKKKTRKKVSKNVNPNALIKVTNSCGFALSSFRLNLDHDFTEFKNSKLTFGYFSSWLIFFWCLPTIFLLLQHFSVYCKRPRPQPRHTIPELVVNVTFHPDDNYNYNYNDDRMMSVGAV